jgi:hypothetical protein
MFCLFTEIYWSLVEVILEQNWRVLLSGFKVVSNDYYFSNMSSPFTAGKMATAHQISILEIQKRRGS